MQEILIKVESFEDIRAISDLAAMERYDIAVSDGRRTVNASSLMCIFSLDLEHPLQLQLHCDRPQAQTFRQKAARFLAE